MTEKATRYDLDAERAVLAEALLAPEILSQLAAALRPEDFYEPAHVLVWAAVQAVHGAGHPVDVRTLATELQGRGRLNTAGGAQYLGDLSCALPSVAHWEAHVAIVAEHARARRAREAVLRALASLDSPDKPSGEAVTDALSHVAALRDESRGPGGSRPVEDCAVELWEDLEALLARGSRAVLTGLPSLDGTEDREGLLGGLHSGQLVCLAAPTGGGKTALAMQVAEHVARGGRPVLVVSQEMPARELLTRLAAAKAGLPASRARAGRFGSGEMERFGEALEDLARLPLEILDTGRATPSDVRAQALRLKALRGDLGLIVVDYLQILRPDHRDPNPVRQLEEMSRDLKTIPVEAGCPLLLLSQFNREPARAAREPQLHDLRGSGSIENDADVVIFLHAGPPPKDPDTGEQLPRPDREPTDLIVAKHRQGSTGRAKLIFDRPSTRFEEASVGVEDIPRSTGGAARGWGAGARSWEADDAA